MGQGAVEAVASPAIPSANGYQVVFKQAETLLDAQSIPRQPALGLIHTFSAEGLEGPFKKPRRFSAINGDGFPFQWSVSLGRQTASLRFLTDCGVPGSRISERIKHTRARLGDVAVQLGLTDSLPHLDSALAQLLPEASALDASLMGLCLAVELDSSGGVGIKVYVNSEVGDVGERYDRFERCLDFLGRPGAVKRLRTLQMTFGGSIAPAFSALDLVPKGIGRIKLYFRPTDGNARFAALAAQAVGCDQAESQLLPLHRAFCNGEGYPAQAVDFSVEFPPEGLATGFKLDLNTGLLFGSDAEVDERVLNLLNELSFDSQPYALVREIVAGSCSNEHVRSILFVGLAVRGLERKVNVYFHPFPAH
ncbi:hypothetical protein BCF11_0230 [Collimonas sp. PA-H2]|nr:hypothetical protein BCF11_0230 [Collimonas sp. PA-H2]